VARSISVAEQQAIHGTGVWRCCCLLLLAGGVLGVALEERDWVVVGRRNDIVISRR